MKRFATIIAVFSIAFLAAPALGTVHTYQFFLTGAQEVPPVSPSGFGDCTVTYDDVTNLVSVMCNYSNLTTPANAAHIHPGAPGMNGGPLITLAHTPATSGTASVTNASVSAANEAVLLAGNMYINVHSTMHGPGEIRGQIVDSGIPAVSTWGLIGLVLLVSVGGSLLLIRRFGRISVVAQA